MMEPNYKWEEKHAIVFNDFIVNLNKKGLRYFILRNYEGLPNVNAAKDVDVIIEPGCYKQAAQCLYNAFKKHGIPRYYVVKYERVRCWIGMDLDEDFSIHIDLIEGYLNKGFEIFTFDDLYAYTKPYKNMIVLNDVMDATMLLLYKVIGCGELKDRYKTKVEDQYRLHEKEINESLYKVLSGSTYIELVKDLANGNFDKIVSDARKISLNSKVNAFNKRPFFTIINVLNFVFEKIYRIVWCPKKFQKMIAVEAPDGTGKTTFIDLMSLKLAEMFVTDISKMHVYHFRPTILPNLGAVGEKATAGKVKQDTNFTDPHRNPPAGFISSFIRMSYYWMDYIIGGFICKRKDVQFDKFTIFDRYIYDFIVDPVRSRIGLPIFLRKLFACCVYQPQIVFVLLCQPEIVYKRKQELTLKEITRQMTVFESLCSMGDRFYKLDASKTPGEIAKDAVRRIIETYTLEVK